MIAANRRGVLYSIFGVLRYFAFSLGFFQYYTMDFYYSSKCLRYMHRNSHTDAIVRSFISSCDCFESVEYAKMLTRVIAYTCVTIYVSPYPTSNFLNCFFGKTILSDQDAMISCSISLSFISCFL